jgi:hypothetical protein
VRGAELGEGVVSGPYVVHVLGPCVGTRVETFLAMRAGNVFFRPIYEPTELELTFDADCERDGRLRLLDALEDIDYEVDTRGVAHGLREYVYGVDMYTGGAAIFSVHAGWCPAAKRWLARCKECRVAGLQPPLPPFALSGAISMHLAAMGGVGARAALTRAATSFDRHAALHGKEGRPRWPR